MRMGHDGLFAVVRERWKKDPLTGHLFVFFGRTHDRVKVLFWDRGGVVVYYKRLEKGRLPMAALDRRRRARRVDRRRRARRGRRNRPRDAARRGRPQPREAAADVVARCDEFDGRRSRLPRRRVSTIAVSTAPASSRTSSSKSAATRSRSIASRSSSSGSASRCRGRQ